MAKESDNSQKERKSTSYKDDVLSTVTLAAGATAYLYTMWNQDFVDSVDQALRHGRHFGKTVYDGATGGPEGYKSAKNLEDALEIVESATGSHYEASQALESYNSSRKKFANDLVTVYEDGETLSQITGRAKIQLEGLLKSTFDAGTSLKGETWKKIDDVILKLYGQNPKEARAKDARLTEFYKKVNDFYDTREKNEHTVKEFCDYLGKVQDRTTQENEMIEKAFPELIARVKEGYETETELFATGDKNFLGLRSSVSSSELEDTKSNVDGLTKRVDETYETVGQAIPMEKFEKTTFFEYINPVTIGIGAAVLAKGLSKLLPGPIERPLTKALALPFNAVKYVAWDSWASGNKKANKGTPPPIPTTETKNESEKTDS